MTFFDVILLRKISMNRREAIRKIMLAMLLASASASWAEVWVEVGKNDKYTAYIDPSTIRKEGDIAKAWDMFDYQADQTGYGGRRYRSVKRQLEYDCKQGKSRGLAVSAHTEHLAKGNLLAASSVGDAWKVVAAGTIDESLWRYVCTKSR
jgi:hypothetical protein